MKDLEGRLGGHFIKVRRKDLLTNPRNELERISLLTGFNTNVDCELGYSISDNGYYERMYECLFGQEA